MYPQYDKAVFLAFIKGDRFLEYVASTARDDKHLEAIFNSYVLSDSMTKLNYHNFKEKHYGTTRQ